MSKMNPCLVKLSFAGLAIHCSPKHSSLIKLKWAIVSLLLNLNLTIPLIQI